MKLSRLNRVLQLVTVAALAMAFIGALASCAAQQLVSTPLQPIPSEAKFADASAFVLLIAHCDQGQCGGNQVMRYEASFSLHNATQPAPQLRYTGSAAIGLRQSPGPAIGLRVQRNL
jgi:hypothetical protein